MSAEDELTWLRKEHAELKERNRVLETIIKVIQLAIAPVTDEAAILAYIEHREKKKEAPCSPSQSSPT